MTNTADALIPISPISPISQVTQFRVRKSGLNTTQLHTAPAIALQPGEARLRVDSFALTSNNITYAAFGDAMAYWQFFPLQGADGEGWGCIPVWGFATVLESRCDGVVAGEKFYGYYPMASQVVLQPARLAPAGFVDGAPHRQPLPGVYNQYLRCSADPLYTPASEDVQSLLRPLFITSFLVDDFLADNDFFGACAAGKGIMLLSSASSKTAYGTAFQLAQRAGVEVLGLTSPGNAAFCESLGCYHRVLTYGQLDQVAPGAACVYVDFAGNAALRQRIHSQFSQLKYSCSIGGTHVGELSSKGGARDLPGPRPTLFFAPAQIKKRHADWGAQVFAGRLMQAWGAFTQRVTRPDAPWLVVEHHRGAQAVETTYRAVLGAGTDPRAGHILQL